MAEGEPHAGPLQGLPRGSVPYLHVRVDSASDVPARVVATAGASPASPWRLGLAEGLDFCRDGETLLQQLRQRIRTTGEQLSTAGAAAEGGREKEREGEAGAGTGKGDSGRKSEQQELLEEEINECLTEIW